MNFSALSPVAVAFPSPPILFAVSQHPDPWPSTYDTHMHYLSVEFLVSNTEIIVTSSDYNILKIIQHRFWLGSSKDSCTIIWSQFGAKTLQKKYVSDKAIIGITILAKGFVNIICSNIVLNCKLFFNVFFNFRN